MHVIHWCGGRGDETGPKTKLLPVSVSRALLKKNKEQKKNGMRGRDMEGSTYDCLCRPFVDRKIWPWSEPPRRSAKFWWRLGATAELRSSPLRSPRISVDKDQRLVVHTERGNTREAWGEDMECPSTARSLCWIIESSAIGLEKS
jgi:hypothetical protein